ncbi:MAG: 23S rRNA (uracil(1939)-C(5))-methyltransferase RlmD [Desulfosudaceae bacterium]
MMQQVQSPSVKKGAEVELGIEDLAFGGRGVARYNGLTVFVDNAVPGDTVRARIIKKKKRFAEARLLEVLAPSAFRREPVCPLCGYCGGCRLQILEYAKQLEFKAAQVKEILARIGSLPEVTVLPVIPADQTLGYRNKMEFACSDRRWLLPEELDDPAADTGFALGLHVPGTFYKILDVKRCHLFPDEVSEILDCVRQFIRRSPLPVYSLRSHTGFWRFVMMRHSVVHDHWLVNLVTAAEKPDHLRPLAELLMERFPRVAAVVNNITASKAGVAVGEKEIPLAGVTRIEERLGECRFDISANSFFQTNTRGAERLYRAAAEYAGLTGRETVVDLYCGTGTIGIWLSRMAARVIGLEISGSCLADAERNRRKNGAENVRFIPGDVKESLAALHEAVDVLVIDPPRAGMHKVVVRQILAMAPGRIIYVSCNPATLARDAALLAEAYTVAEVQPVDMFPHTPHIESVARLVRKDMAHE